MNQFEFFYLSFLLYFLWIWISVGDSYRIEPEPGFGGLSSKLPTCVWLPVQSGQNFTLQVHEPIGKKEISLNCQVRKLPVDFWNYTLSREQLETTTQANIKCSDQLYFESFLHPNQKLFQLTNLISLQIHACKIRKLPKSLWLGLGQSLKSLTVSTQNGDWSSSLTLEIDVGGLDGLGNLERLDLSYNNLWSLDESLLCPLRSLRHLNLSHNRLSQDFVEELSDSSTTTSSLSSTNQNLCPFPIGELDLSYNAVRRVRRNGFNLFKRITDLRLQNNYIEDVSEAAFEQLHQLRLLNLSSNRLVSLPLTLFNHHQSQLRQLYLQNNSISALSPQVFSSLDQLLLLDMSRNGLSSLWVKETIFSSLVRLIILKLSYNQLTFIDSTVFADLISLQALHLDSNKIENLNPEAFASLTNLDLLDLSRNRLSFIDGRIFGNLWVLRQLYLDHNKIRSIDDSALVNCSSLRDLGIAGNLLQEVPVALRLARGLGFLETLDLGENKINGVSNESFSGLGQIYGLRLVDNKITLLPQGFCSPLRKLRILNLAQNKLSQIASTAFSGCPELRALRLDTNILEELPLTFSPQLPSLLWLNVSENRLRWADYHLLPPMVEWVDLSHNQLVTLGRASSKSTGTARTLNHLRVIDASYNNLTHLDYTTVPTTLETLRLNSNRLSAVAPDTFSRASRLRRVELMNNQLTSLSLSALRLPTVPVSKALPEFFLGGNSFICNCAMDWLTRTNQLSLVRQYPQIMDIDGIMCTSARTTDVTSLPDTLPSQFLCPYTSHCFQTCQCCLFDACDCFMTCPDNCTCYYDTAWSVNIVECSNLGYRELPQRIPMDATALFLDGNQMGLLGSHIFIGKKNLRILWLNGSEIEVIRNKTFNGLRALEILYLNDNRLTEIHGYEFVDLENLTELHLQNNLLRTISSTALKHLKFLKILRLDGNHLMDFNIWELSGNSYLNSFRLSRNPWSCDCEFLIPFRTWVNSRQSVVEDFGLARCQPDLNSNGTGILIASLCFRSGENFNNVNEVETNNQLLASGDGTMTQKGVIHHSRIDSDEKNRERDGSETTISKKSRNETNHTNTDSSNSFWTLWLCFVGILLLFAAIVLIFHREVQQWILRRWLVLIDNCCHRRQSHGREKVCSTDSSTTNMDESDKLFDAYFLYNRKDEDLLTQKLTPELEFGQQRTNGSSVSSNGLSLRLLLHYRDLCLNTDVSALPWNLDMTLSAAESSKRVVIILSKSFLQVELSQPASRPILQSLIQRYSQKILFILLPPLNETGLTGLYPEFRLFNNTVLDWLDPNFWPKLKILLPTPTGNNCYVTPARSGTHLNSPMNISNNDSSWYNQSLSSSGGGGNYHRNIMPYQYPPSQLLYNNGSSNYEPFGGSVDLVRDSLPPLVPKHHILLPVSNCQEQFDTNEKILRKPNTVCPTDPLQPHYCSFADNFRFHQQHQHQPFTFATIQRPPPHEKYQNESNLKHHHSISTFGSSKAGNKLQNHAYKPLVRNPPPPPPSHSTASSTEDSGNVNCSGSSSDELENEHVYSTLDSPLQSPNENFTTNSNPGTNENRTMYFV